MPSAERDSYVAHLRNEVARWQAEATRWRTGHYGEMYDIETALAPVLGYDEHPPGSPGYSPDFVSYDTADHTAVTLANEAATAMARIRTAAGAALKNHRSLDPSDVLEILDGPHLHG